MCFITLGEPFTEAQQRIDVLPGDVAPDDHPNVCEALGSEALHQVGGLRALDPEATDEVVLLSRAGQATMDALVDSHQVTR